MTQAVDAIYSHGPQFQMDHTPSSAVSGGSLLSFGTGTKRLVAVADVALEANRLGAVSISGGYKLKKKANVTFEVGETVEWDEDPGQAVDAGDGGGDFAAGVCIAPAVAADDFVVTAINLALAEPGEGSS